MSYFVRELVTFLNSYLSLSVFLFTKYSFSFMLQGKFIFPIFLVIGSHLNLHQRLPLTPCTTAAIIAPLFASSFFLRILWTPDLDLLVARLTVVYRIYVFYVSPIRHTQKKYTYILDMISIWKDSDAWIGWLEFGIKKKNTIKI